MLIVAAGPMKMKFMIVFRLSRARTARGMLKTKLTEIPSRHQGKE